MKGDHDPAKNRDPRAFVGQENVPRKNVPKAKKRIILNTLNILLKRGVYGLYIYAEDEALNKHLRESLA